MASIIFASDVQTVDNWYPVRSGARLMADGTGRFAEFECHPDEQVEAIRWLNCDAEIQQAIGRVRGVRRTADNPVRVIVLNGVEKAKLAQLWKTGELVLPWSERPVQLRRASLGLLGKNHRYVWLAAHIELETARIALDAPQTGDNEARF